jgi:three-Cys-motif partner protein
MSSDRRGKYGESESTKVKLGIFQNLITMHVGICAGQAWCRDYHYIDMNAGPGIAPECQERGSPLLFLDAVQAQTKPLAYHALMIDSNLTYAHELQAHVARYGRVTVEHGDHARVAPAYLSSLKNRPHGIVYHDPNGVPSWETLASIFALPQARYLDLLLYVRTTDLKRVSGLRHNRNPF